MAANPSPSIVRFGVFELDRRTSELRKQGVKVRLQEQPSKLLLVLLERPGEIVSREELRTRIWPANTFVEFDQGLYSAIARLRDTLGDSSDNPRFIETVARRGYRFVAPVDQISAEEPPKPEVSASGRGRGFLVSLVAGLLGGTLLLAVVVGFNLMGVRERFSRGTDRVQSVAVLPLENLSGDPEQDYFADGMTEALTTDLAKIASLRVISRTSAMQYKGAHKPVSVIARELGVDAVVEGSVMRSGHRVRISAQLIRARSEKHLWAEMYDRDLDDVLRLQGQVAQTIADQIRAQVTPEERAYLAKTPSVDVEPYELYLRGRFYWNKRNPEGLTKSKELFEQAIAKDPSFALAYVGLADTYIVMTDSFPIPASVAMAKSRAASLKALELDENLAEAHASLAFVHFQLDWDWPAAEREFQRAIALNPGYATAHHWYSMYLSAMGRCDESISEFHRAREVDPLSMIVRLDGAAILYWCRQLDPALAEARHVLEMDPGYQKAHLYLAGLYVHKGMVDQSMVAYQKWADLSGARGSSAATQIQAWLWAMSGNRDDAIQAMARLRKVSPDGTLNSYLSASVDSALGNRDDGLKELEEAFSSRNNLIVYMKVDPKLDGLRDDPRFQRILQKMKLG